MKKKRNASSDLPHDSPHTLDGPMGKIEYLVQLELIRQLVIPGPARPGWSLSDIYPVRPGADAPHLRIVPLCYGGDIDDPADVGCGPFVSYTRDLTQPATLELQGRVMAVLKSAITVRNAAFHFGSKLNTAIQLASETADLSARARAFFENEGSELMYQLHLSAEVRRVNDVLQHGPESVSKCILQVPPEVFDGSAAAPALRFVEEAQALVCAPGLLHQRGQALERYWIALMHEEGLGPTEIAEVLGELPAGCSEDDPDAMSRRTDKRKAVSERIYRATSALRAESTPQKRSRVDLERRALVVGCSHVPRDQPIISVRLRGGEAVPNVGE